MKVGRETGVRVGRETGVRVGRETGVRWGGRLVWRVGRETGVRVAMEQEWYQDERTEWSGDGDGGEDEVVMIIN